MGGVIKPGDAAQTAAQALISVLNDNGIVAAEGFPPMSPEEQRKIPLSSNSPNIVVVEVGPKPLPESLQMGPPSESDAAGGKTWGNIAE